MKPILNDVTTERLLQSAFPDSRQYKYLGSGGMSDVWALHFQSKQLAVKITAARTISTMLGGSRYLNEARIRIANEVSTSLSMSGQSKFTVQVYDGWFLTENLEKVDPKQADYALLVEEVLTPCTDFFARPANRTEYLLRKLCREIACGLNVLHRAGIVHRDCLLRNLFYRPSADCFVLGDFGISRPVETTWRPGTRISRGFDASYPPELRNPAMLGSSKSIPFNTDLYILSRGALQLSHTGTGRLSGPFYRFLKQNSADAIIKRPCSCAADFVHKLDALPPLRGDTAKTNDDVTPTGTRISTRFHAAPAAVPLRALIEQERFQEAVRILSALPQKDAQQAALYTALCLILDGDNTPTTEHLQLLEPLVQKQNPEACFAAALCYLKKIEPDKAEPLLRQAERKRELYALAQYYLGRIAYQRGDSSTGNKLWSLALKQCLTLQALERTESRAACDAIRRREVLTALCP